MNYRKNVILFLCVTRGHTRGIEDLFFSVNKA